MMFGARLRQLRRDKQVRPKKKGGVAPSSKKPKAKKRTRKVTTRTRAKK